ncbi:hypothetical protein MMC30_007126 [Trapelia coarctata]|nr:hypothetical protein [Trapelia coarctata]
MPGTVDLNALRAQAIGSGLDEEAVTVNTRALIDKVLARYSGEWTVLRELLQNAADASACKVTIKFETLPSSTVPLPQTSEASALLKHTILHHTLKSLVVSNDGTPFGSSDWSRLKRIAEGNPDETKIGAFGVGFYSVFSDCEEPFVRSGKEAMAFYWKGNSLFTKRLQLAEDQSTAETNFVLNYRNNTSPVPKILPLCQFLASSMTFVGLTQVELWLDNHRLLAITKLTAPGAAVTIPKTLETKTAEGFFCIQSVVRETAQLEAKWLNIVAWVPKSTANTSHGNGQSSTGKGTSSSQSLRSFFSRFASNMQNAAAEKIAREERVAQDAISENLMGECKATVFLHVNRATVSAKFNSNFSNELERATKKPPPTSTKLAILTSSYDENAASTSSVSGTASKMTDIFASVLPSRSGRVFIGFPTHQTTGLSAHISAQSVIPTVERESIDLNARWVRTWNMEMLRAAGIVCRIAWTGEIDSLKENLLQSSKATKGIKISPEDISKALPEAVHILNQFTFRESTPSSQVGSLVEEAFWTCNKTSTIEVLSSRGVLPSQEVRIATEELSFVDGIPVLPSELLKNASGFVKKLTDYGIITDITTGDIKKELERQALNEKQLVEFLHWIGHKAKIHEIDAVVVRSLLDVAVANEDPNSSSMLGKVIVLGEIRHFLNPSKIPGNVPVPSNTLPFKFTQKIDRLDLEALGWEDLQIVPWLRWLVEATGGKGALSMEQDLSKSATFACVVLPILSKQWDGLSPSSKGTVISLLNDRTVIPTKFGMRKPSDAYFPSVKLFEDLPVVSGLQSVKEKFLIALGVRKTVELGLVFDRLMAPPEYTADPSLARPAWSHVDLIKYLASVRKDIPANDMLRLKSTPICPAVGGTVHERYRVAELFEPNGTLQSLGLRLLQWPGTFRSGSDEGRFLSLLGLRSIPTAEELIPLIARAAADGNIVYRDRVLKYFVSNHFQYGYSIAQTAETKIPFLPLEGEDPKTAVLPTQCFINGNATVLGFKLLRKDLHPYAARLGVQNDPPIMESVDRLIKEPPETKRRAAELFGYFATRLQDISGRPLEILKQANFVPVPSRTTDSKTSIRHLTPHLCFLGDGAGDNYAEIFDYVDFGMDANSFLLKCGSKHEPSTLELAQLVVREPARIFTVFESPERYLELLRAFAGAWTSLKKDKTLVKDMKKTPFLLGYKDSPSESNRRARQDQLVDVDSYPEEDVGVRTYELAAADKIHIVDDIVSYNLFKGHFLAAPMEESLEDFYLALGSTSLGNLVEQKLQLGSPLPNQQDATKLEKLIRERIRLFLHEVPRDQIYRDAAWIEKNLSIVVVQTLAIRKVLRGRNASHTETKTAFQEKDLQLGHKVFRGHTLFIVSGIRDLYDVSQALSGLLLYRPKPQHAITLTVLLETDLHKLRARGYNVERILQRKAAEARVADEQRRKQLAEEQQQRLEDQEAARIAGPAQRPEGSQQDHVMPGLFPDSPDHKGRRLQSQGSQIESAPHRGRGSFFDAISRTFRGGDHHLRPSGQVGDGAALPPPPYAPSDPQHQSLTTTNPSQPSSTPRELQQNLISAIKASQPHNYNEIVTQPRYNNVQETKTFCDAKPAQNISYIAQLNSEIKLYLSHKTTNKQGYIDKNLTAMNAFAAVLCDCADSMGLNRGGIHVFEDEGSSTIAFNQNKALFFNYRYFEKLHWEGVMQGRREKAIVYWFVVMCHELAHNLVGDHSSAHSFYTESFITEYFAAAARKAGEGSQSGNGALRLS